MAVYLKKYEIIKLIIIFIIFITIIIIMIKNSKINIDTDYDVNESKSYFQNTSSSKWRSSQLQTLKSEDNYPKHFIATSSSINEAAMLKNKLRIVHLDLKGAPPKISYLFNLLPSLREAGANGLLIEYEDMFPFEGIIKNISAKNSYSKQDIIKLVEIARTLKLEVIPLVQTFGHMEFILKLREFRHLRELDEFPQEVCPAKEGAFVIIKEMIKQVMALHEGSRFLHIGCDEVFHISACSICSRRNPRMTFTEHVKKVGYWVRNKYPGVTPLIWDDMLRHWSPSDLQDSLLGEVVEPMVWVYIDDINRLVPHYIWYMYKKAFPRLWAASAFKGAFGESVIIPDIERHFQNNFAWVRLMKDRSSNQVAAGELFGGIVLTGWSRYDHFAILAEILPIGTPSLILNLVFITTNFEEENIDRPDAVILSPKVFTRWLSILQCPKDFPSVDIEILKKDKNQWNIGTCAFPGSNLYTMMSEYFFLKSRLDTLNNKIETNGWVSEYNVRHNYTSPWRVLNFAPEEGFGGITLKRDVTRFKSHISKAMTQYFDNYTISEWIDQKLLPMEMQLNKIETTFQNLLKRRVWSRRPTSRGVG